MDWTHPDAPAFLYKFYGTDENGMPKQKDLDVLSEGKVWLSSPEHYNDPCDNILSISERINPDWIMKTSGDADIKQLLRFSLSFLKVSCFSANDSESLWGYYGSGHKGFCIRVETPEKSHKVEYEPLLPVNFPVKYYRENPKEVFVGALSRKDKSWEHEEEWRVIIVDLDDYDTWPVEILEVIFGIDCSESCMASVMKALQNLDNVRFYRRYLLNYRGWLNIGRQEVFPKNNPQTPERLLP